MFSTHSFCFCCVRRLEISLIFRLDDICEKRKLKTLGGVICFIPSFLLILCCLLNSAMNNTWGWFHLVLSCIFIKSDFASTVEMKENLLYVIIWGWERGLPLISMEANDLCYFDVQQNLGRDNMYWCVCTITVCVSQALSYRFLICYCALVLA